MNSIAIAIATLLYLLLYILHSGLSTSLMCN